MDRKPEPTKFHFDISLSVLNHLGRNLYRSFVTVLGEALSNSWDADATNVHIVVDARRGNMYIRDDGHGMTADDFQGKFLKIGYSKRNEANESRGRHRPFIGRKGIGKLALLSCARRITIASKVPGEEYVGGTINNSGLDKAITEDLAPSQYSLETLNVNALRDGLASQKQGTVIRFEGLNEGIRHSLAFLKKTIALYFRFSLIDKSFHIFLNGEKVSTSCLDDLAMKTEYLWIVNDIDDPYIDHLQRIFTPGATNRSN